MTKEQVVFWLLLLRFNPDNNVLPNEVIDIAIGAIVAQPERKTGKWIKPNNQVAVAQDEWICSSCHYLVLHRHKFCPECGSYNGGMR